MTTPTNIRFTAEESEAIDAYARSKDLRRTSAVRELVRIGLQNADSSGLNVAGALRGVAAQLEKMSGVAAQLEKMCGVAAQLEKMSGVAAQLEELRVGQLQIKAALAVTQWSPSHGET